MGRQLGASFIDLKKYMESEWEITRKTLSLTDDATIAGLWSSLWRTLSLAALSRDDAGAAKICRGLALQTVTHLSRAEIPNGLPSPYESLIPIDFALYQLAGSWGKREVIGCLDRCGIEIKQCVAADIARLLKSVDRDRSITDINFPLLFTSLSQSRCHNGVAEILESIALVVWDEMTDQERETARNSMSHILFRNETGRWSEPRILLCGNIGDKEEELRVQFAPESVLLSNEYNQNGRAFFRRCRPRYEAPTEALTAWVLKADSEIKRKAALKYLVSGELGHKVCRQIRERGLTGTWLENIRVDHKYLYDWEDNDKNELLRLLVEHIIIPHENPIPIQPLNPHKTLTAIYEWWQRNSANRISQYENETFPQGRFPNLTCDILKHEPDARKGWLTLFLLGACHTIGRTSSEQHRTFLELCYSKGWMDKFITKDRNSLDEWMGVVKNYLENEIQDPEYFHWMKEFVSIFLLGYWLDEYVESFMAINRMQSPFTLVQITCPRSNPLFQGGGPDAPPITRALGMGACFVLRELVRKGIIKNSRAHQYSFVPRKFVREFLLRIGCDGIDGEKDHGIRSKIIYQFLCQHLGEKKATFGNSFDLPLMFIARESDLQKKIFKEKILESSEIDEAEDYDE